MGSMEAQFIEPFSPAIMHTKVPNKFVTIVNNASDVVLGDESTAKKFDLSDFLDGKVSKERSIPIYSLEHLENGLMPQMSLGDQANFMSDILRNSCLQYLNLMIKRGHAHSWSSAAGDTVPTTDNIRIDSSWVVNHYKNEYNPWHKHNGDFSGVIYLKIPDGMSGEHKKEPKTATPKGVSGLIDFMFGEECEFRTTSVKFQPEVGLMLIFPSWLKHFVYPFYSDGERRSMSFNASMVIAKR